jgi:hypothetical protein
MIVQCPVTAGFSWLVPVARSRLGPTAGRSVPVHGRGVRGTKDASALVQLTDCVSAAVTLAQSRSIVIDMMQLTGMDHSEAREPLPNLD